ncbi:MAG: replicative DNA helicase, partial [Desulfobulbaceae bacterium]|nr:replicative DNA helicase [Desulfobulbaceae bacterium]
AGRPSMGKSAMLSNIIENVCYHGKSALMFSLEMGKDQLTERFFSSIGRVNFGRIRSGYIENQDWSKLTHASSEFHSFNLHIDDTPAITLSEIRYKARAIKRKHGLDLLGIDYLQLMGMPDKQSRVQAIGEVSRGLKQLARELDIPIVLLSQLNRSVDGRNDKRPTMSDLRDSGEIEQDADVILFPFRPSAYCDKCRDKKDNADHDTELHQSVSEIIVEKQRNGERNMKIKTVWIGKYQKFDNLEI